MNKYYLFLAFLLPLFSCNNEDANVNDNDPIALDREELLIRVGEEETLTLLNFDPNAEDENTVQWVSTDSDVVAVEDGIIKGISAGRSLVYAEIDSFQTYSCAVTVSGVYDKDYDVYIGGTDGSKATYWKNGIPVHLSSDSEEGEVHAMVIQGNDVYAAGSELKYNGLRAKYWKNGEEVELSEKTSYALDIFVSGSDVYVAGNVINEETSKYVATVWKNGVETSLSDGSQLTLATAVFVDENDVYVGGHSLIPGKTVPKYWKNGEEIVLSPFDDSSVNDILVHNNDLYIVGTEFTNNGPRAKYWKNGEEVFLTSSGIKSYSRSIAIDGGDTYVSGYVLDENPYHYVPAYWKNGTQVKLSQEELIRHDCDIACSNGQVYYIGNMFYSANFQIPKYWKNGNEIQFLPWKDGLVVRTIEIAPKN